MEAIGQSEPPDFSSMVEDGNSASGRFLKDLIGTEDLSEDGEEDCHLFSHVCSWKIALIITLSKVFATRYQLQGVCCETWICSEWNVVLQKLRNLSEVATLCNKVQGS